MGEGWLPQAAIRLVVEETVGVGKASPLQGLGKGESSNEAGVGEGDGAGPRRRLSQTGSLGSSVLGLRRATSPNVVDRELRGRQRCCILDDLGVAVILEGQDSRWQPTQVGILSITQIPCPYFQPSF